MRAPADMIVPLLPEMGNDKLSLQGNAARPLPGQWLDAVRKLEAWG